jgi:hypothetical protein
MSYVDDKLDIIDSDRVKDSSNGPRQNFKKHMHYKDGSPRYEILETDSKGVVVKVSMRNRMDGVVSIWNRVDKDLFEKEIK